MSELRAVSENVEGETVLGRVEAMVANGCPGPAGLWKCAREFGHEDGEHVRIGDGVSKLKAERDELLAAAKDAAIRLEELGLATGYKSPMALGALRAAIAKAEEGR